MIPGIRWSPDIRWSPGIRWSPAIRWSIRSMDFDNPKVYGDTFISDGLVFYHHHRYYYSYWPDHEGPELCLLHDQVPQSLSLNHLDSLDNLDRSRQWQLSDCSDWQRHNEENEAESVLELGQDEVSEAGWSRIIEIFTFIDQVIGAMKSNLSKDVPQGPPCGNTARH